MSSARAMFVIDSSRQDRRSHPSLEFSVAGDIVPGQGLLDHDQVEVVELDQVVRVVQGVRVVRVGHQRRFRAEPLADGVQVVEVLARLDLQLDLPVALGQRLLRLVGQLFGRTLGYRSRCRCRSVSASRPSSEDRL